MTKDSTHPPEQNAGYEAPLVEDLDSGQGPVETAASVLPSSIPPTTAAPREL